MGQRKLDDQWSPKRWANALTTILNATYNGANRFPVDIQKLALDYSAQRFPEEPILRIEGADLPGFDGALIPFPSGKKAWGIAFNSRVSSPGRIRFTLAHEFGHYLIHRLRFPNGIQCTPDSMTEWRHEYAVAEQQANEFAATLLMPLDDFRSQIHSKSKPTLEHIGNCAKRYQVSLTAAAYRWIEYTERRSVLVISRDGFILRARSSQSAFQTGAFFRTTNREPISVPRSALANQASIASDCAAHAPGVWFDEPCEEIVLRSDRYDFAVSLLHLNDASNSFVRDDESHDDVFDYMKKRSIL